jgi:hypothetical protein
MALNLQSDGGQQAYEDAELARTEQERLRQLSIQSEFDRRYAHSLDRNGNERPGLNSEEEKKQIATHFGVSIEACVSNKVDVVGKCIQSRRSILYRLFVLTEDNDCLRIFEHRSHVQWAYQSHPPFARHRRSQ